MKTQEIFFLETVPGTPKVHPGAEFSPTGLSHTDEARSGFLLEGRLEGHEGTHGLDLRILVTRSVLPDSELVKLKARVEEDPARALKWLRSLTEAKDLGII